MQIDTEIEDRTNQAAGMLCVAFRMADPNKAWKHLRSKPQPLVRYGSSFEGKAIHTWDDGERVLFRCGLCGGYYLLQDSEFHSISGDDDRFYSDYFPVTGYDDAERLNRKYDGLQIELEFPGRYLIQDNASPPSWKGNG